MTGLILAGAAWIAALVLLTFHETSGLPSQRVVVRWVPAITEAERERLEQQGTLVDGERNDRTWSYVLRDQSRSNIERLVSNPLVQDTAHIDRTRFRVELDRPDLPSWLRSAEETGIVVALALLLVVAGVAPAWRARALLRRSVGASRRFAEHTLSQFDEVESAKRLLWSAPTTVSRSHRLVDLVLLTLTAGGVLLLCLRTIGADRLHIGFQNDQLNYVTAARELADSGTLNSHLIYPATLYQNKPRNYLYMPGFAYALASSYKVFGYGVFQSLLPNLLSFVLTAIGVYLIGAKLSGRAVGWMGAGLFMLFPLNLISAVTVMNESTLTLATTLALGVFIYLPASARISVGPFLAVVPFVFRETGALIVAPLLLLLLAWNRRSRFTKALTFAVLAFSLLVLVFQSPISTQRPLVANPFDDRFENKFTDVVAAKRAAASVRHEWMQILRATTERNVREAFKSPVLGSEKSILLVVTVLVGAVGLRRRNMFCLAAALFTCLAFAVVVSFYRWETRILLFTVPGLAVALALVIAEYVLGPVEKRRITRHALAITMLVIVSTYAVVRLGEYCSSVPDADERDDRYMRALESVPIDQAGVLTAPDELVYGYVLHHYPIRFSFLPANDDTLDLLNARYPIGTVILPKESDLPWARPGSLEQMGLALTQTVRIGEKSYVVYKRYDPRRG